VRILVIDVGGTHVKMLATGQEKARRFASGKGLGPDEMVKRILELSKDWEYGAVSIGYPGLVDHNGIKAEPANLAPGWVGFHFSKAFGRPVKILNDAAMQALGSYEGGRMLFLSLGTGVGSTLISGKVIVPLELSRLAYGDGDIGAYLGREALERLGLTAWRQAIEEIVPVLKEAFVADYVVLGGGNASKAPLPPGTRRGSNDNSFRGGFRLWATDMAPTQTPHSPESQAAVRPEDWYQV
jgi:polyphosphate glucokinase